MVLYYQGLALETSIAGFCASVLMDFDLKKNHLALIEKSLICDLLKILCASIASVALALGAYKGMLGITGDSLDTISALGIAVVVCLTICAAWNVDIMVWVYSNFFQKLKVIKNGTDLELYV